MPTPGWYIDDLDETKLNYWDGKAWTGETRPRPIPEHPEFDPAPPAVSLKDLPAPTTSAVDPYSVMSAPTADSSIYVASPFPSIATSPMSRWPYWVFWPLYILTLPALVLQVRSAEGLPISQAAGFAANILVYLTFIASVVWVGVDSSNLISSGTAPGGVGNTSTITWVIACVFLWIFLFPWYLISRAVTASKLSPTISPSPAPAHAIQVNSTQSPYHSPGLIGELEHLANLYRTGHLTPAEYSAAKARLLG